MPSIFTMCCRRAIQSIISALRRLCSTCLSGIVNETSHETPQLRPSISVSTPVPQLSVCRSQECDLKVKNIYRMPVSRSYNRPRSKSYSICRSPKTDNTSRAHTCSHNLHKAGSQWTRNNDTSGFQQQDMSGDDRLPNNVARVSIVDSPELNLNFLMTEMRPRALTMPAMPPPIFKSQTKEVCYKTCKHDYVKDKDHMCYPRQNESSSCNSLSLHSNDNNAVSFDNERLHGASMPQNDSVNINGRVIQSIDEQGNVGQSLLLTIETKGNFIKEKTSVKALSSGTALIVTLVPKVPLNSKDEIITPITERLPLPWTINPYHVKASVQKDGILTIRAPIVK